MEQQVSMMKDLTIAPSKDSTVELISDNNGDTIDWSFDIISGDASDTGSANSGDSSDTSNASDTSTTNIFDSFMLFYDDIIFHFI